MVAGDGDRAANTVLATEARGSRKAVSHFTVLTKLGISSKLQDLLILWGEEVLRGYQSPVTSPLPLAQILW